MKNSLVSALCGLALAGSTYTAPAHAVGWLDDLLRGERAVARTAKATRAAADAERRHRQLVRTRQLQRERVVKDQVARDVQRARKIELNGKQQSLSQKFADIRDPYVIYGRTNPATGAGYVGQAKGSKRFLARQSEHDKKLAVSHQYRVIGTAPSRQTANVAEETGIRMQKNNPATGRVLQNKRYQIKESVYRQNGGSAQQPMVSARSPSAGHTTSSTTQTFNAQSGASYSYAGGAGRSGTRVASPSSNGTSGASGYGSSKSGGTGSSTSTSTGSGSSAGGSKS